MSARPPRAASPGVPPPPAAPARPGTGATRAEIDRLVIRVVGADADARRLAERLPGTLETLLGRAASGADERTLRTLVQRAVGQASR